MRVAVVALALAVVGPGERLGGQRSAADSGRQALRSPNPAPTPKPSPEAPASDSLAAREPQTPVDSQAIQPPKAVADSLRQLITRFSRDPEGVELPSPASIRFGPRTVAVGERVVGPVATAGGDLNVYGTVEGDAVAVAGDVVVHPGGRVTGDAVAGFGQARLAGGTVEGELRSLSGAVGAPLRAEAEVVTPVGATRHALSVTLGWLVVVTLIGIGVLIFASGYLDGVTETLQADFSRSLWVGAAAQLGLLPALLAIIIGLALTILGILLIPFAVVAFVLVVIGLLTLGFLATARLTGETLSRGAARRLSARGTALRSVIVGVLIYLGLWLVAAAFTWAPIPAAVLRAIALAVTWVAATAGLGAAVLSRGGSKRLDEEPAAAPRPVSELAWQTPTPVTGVVAARRPTPVSTAGDRR